MHCPTVIINYENTKKSKLTTKLFDEKFGNTARSCMKQFTLLFFQIYDVKSNKIKSIYSILFANFYFPEFVVYEVIYHKKSISPKFIFEACHYFKN